MYKCCMARTQGVSFDADGVASVLPMRSSYLLRLRPLADVRVCPLVHLLLSP
jgi:hypothetical protein